MKRHKETKSFCVRDQRLVWKGDSHGLTEDYRNTLSILLRAVCYGSFTCLLLGRGGVRGGGGAGGEAEIRKFICPPCKIKYLKYFFKFHVYIYINKQNLQTLV